MVLSRGRAVAVAAFAAALLVSACGGGQDAEAETPAASTTGPERTAVSVGVVPVSTVAPLYLGLEKGFFEEAGLDVTAEVVNTGPAIVAGLTSGELQFGFSAAASVIQAMARDVPISVVVGGSYTPQTEPDTSLIAGADSGISSLADLEGKTIAVNALQGQSELGIRAVAERAGVDLSTLQFVAIPFPEMASSLAQGNVDAAGMVNPFAAGAADAGHTVIVEDYYAEMHEALTVTSWIAADSYIESDPDVVTAFSEALSRSFDYAAEHPDEMKAMIPSYTQFSPEAAMALPSAFTSPLVTSETIEMQVELMGRYGMLEGEVTVEDYVAEPVRDRIWQ